MVPINRNDITANQIIKSSQHKD